MLRARDYTLFNSALPKSIRARLRDPQQFAQFMTSAESAAEQAPGHVSNLLSHILLSWCWYYAKATHLFIDPGVLEFAWQATNSNYDSLELPALPSAVSPTEIPDVLRQCTPEPKAVFLHFPRAEAADSVGLLQREWNNPEVGVGMQLNFADSVGVGTAWVGESLTANTSARGERRKPILGAYHRVVAMLLYMDAFPDMVRDPLPNQHLGKATGSIRRVSPDPEMLAEHEHLSMSPHYRRGHLRTYRSGRYKKARGETRWVRGTMIKGAAKEVVCE